MRALFTQVSPKSKQEKENIRAKCNSSKKHQVPGVIPLCPLLMQRQSPIQSAHCPGMYTS